MRETSSVKKSMLVLGAGELGINVLRALAGDARIQQGWQITVLLRPQDPARQTTFGQAPFQGIDVVEADIAAASAEQLAEVFGRFHTVVNCTGFVAGPGSQIKLTRAALQAGVARYVPWQFGVNYDQVTEGAGGGIFDEQIAVRRLLRAQTRTSWLIVSTGMFTSFLFEPAFGVVDLARRKVHALGSWSTPVTVTTPEDIGRLTAELLVRVPEGGAQVYYVAGDTVTYGQVADVLDAHFGSPVERIEWTLAHLRDELARDPQDGMKKYRLAFAQEAGVAWDKAATFNARLGIATQDVAQWVAAHL